MANTKSAEKRARQALASRAANVAQRSKVRSAVRKVVEAIRAGQKDEAAAALKAAAPVIDSIWFAEGFGQYAAIVALAAGMPDPAAYREGMLARRFRSNLASAPPFLRRLPLVELSRVASTRYAEDFRTGRLVFSRGGLMAAALDDRIRSATGGARSLRDALRFLVEWSARERRGFAIDELPGLLQQATGVDVGPVVEEWLRPLP